MASRVRRRHAACRGRDLGVEVAARQFADVDADAIEREERAERQDGGAAQDERLGDVHALRVLHGVVRVVASDVACQRTDQRR